MQPWAIILCNLSDVPPGPNSRQRYVDYFTEAGSGTGGAYDYWRDVSYGVGGLQGSQVFGWFDIGHTRAELAAFMGGAQRSQIFVWGLAATRANNVDLAAFPHKIVILNVSADHGKTSGGVVLAYEDTRPLEPTFIFHEMGHEFGLDHSFGENPTPCASGDGRPGAYCDMFDIMSAMNVHSFQDGQNRRSGPTLNASSRERLGWLPPSRIWSPNNQILEETVVLAPLNRQDINGYLMAKFLAPSRDTTQVVPSTYTIEFKEPVGWDRGFLNNHVFIHEIRTDGLVRLLTNSYGGLLDLNPNLEFVAPNASKVRLLGIDPATHTATLRITALPPRWESLGGGLTSDPAATLNAPGGLVVFARGTDNAIWHTWQDQINGNWHPWASLGGNWTSGPAAALYRDGRLNVFARGTDNAIWTRWQTTPNGNWSQWESLGGGLTSGPAATLNAPGGLVVFARGTDNAIWHTWQDQINGNWHPWASLGGNWTSGPAAALYRDGRLNVFARGTDNAIWTRWQTTPNGDWLHW